MATQVDLDKIARLRDTVYRLSAQQSITSDELSELISSITTVLELSRAIPALVCLRPWAEQRLDELSAYEPRD